MKKIEVFKPNTNIVYQLLGELADLVAHKVVERLQETDELFNKVISVEENVTDEKSDELLTIKEVCEILKIKRGTLYSWDKKGVLKPCTKIGRMQRYKRSSIDAYVNNVELKNN